MSDKDFEAELKNLNTPYCEKSHAVTHRTRKFLTNLSFIVADAWRLSDAAEYCSESVNGESTDPLLDLGRLIHPGEDANRNCICVYMRKLGGQMIRYGEGNCPRHAVVIRASQAAATLFVKLKPLLRDRTLLRAQLKIEEIFRLVAYHGKPTRPPEEYRTYVHGLVEEFLSNLTEYAEKLEEHIGEVIEKRKTAREHAVEPEDIKAIRMTTEKTERKVDIVLVKQEETRKTVNRLDQRDKKAKRNARRRFSVETQELIFGYWNRGNENAMLKRESGNHRVTYEQVFDYYKSELVALGIKNVEVFKDCLRKRRDRIAYERKQRNP